MGSPGDRLRQERLARGLSQEDVADGQFRASYVSRIESGQRPGSDRFWGIVAKRLGVSADYLRTGVDHSQLELTRALAAAAEGNAPLARRVLREMAADAAGAPATRREAAVALADLLYAAGEYHQAAGYLRELIDGMRGDPLAEVRLSLRLSRSLLECGDLHEAADVARLALRRAEDAGVAASPDGVRLRVTYVAILRERGDLATAVREVEIARRDAGRSEGAQAAALWNAALLAADRGDAAGATALAQRARDIFVRLGDEHQSSLVSIASAEMRLVDGHDPREVEREIRAAIPVIAELGGSVQVGKALLQLAHALLRAGDLQGADDQAVRALAELGPDHTLESSRAHALRALLRLRLGDEPAALASAAAAADHLHSIGARPSARRVWSELAEVYAQLGDGDQALDCYRAAMGRAIAAPASHGAARSVG